MRIKYEVELLPILVDLNGVLKALRARNIQLPNSFE